MTSPCASSTAPPELPGDMAASVWIRSTSGAPAEADPGIWRCSPEMMPDVTVASNPSGLPRTVGLDDSDVRSLIGGANLSRHLLPVGEGYGDVLRAGDHVRVGDDGAVGSIDNAAAHAARGEHRDDRGLYLSDECR